MTILQIPQGYARNLSGRSKVKTLEEFAQRDVEFLFNFPSCVPYHRPAWLELEVPDDKTAPWGHEWYQVLPDGTLQMHSADYDSSD